MAMMAAFAVMPVFGVTLFAANSGVGITPSAGRRLISWTAEFYTLLVVAALVVVAAAGQLPGTAFSTDVAVWVMLAALVATPVVAVAAYLVELILSDRIGGAWSGAVPPTAIDAAGVVRRSVDVPTRYVVIAVVTAVFEELLFRGAVFTEVREAVGVVGALLASSALFAFHHISFGPAAVAGKLLAGLGWASLFLVSGTVLVPIASHLMFQFLVYRRMTREIS